VDQKTRIIARLIAYDTEQESVIEVNLARCALEVGSGQSGRANLIEILKTMRNDRQYDAERIGCETMKINTHVAQFEEEFGREAEKACEDSKLKWLERLSALKGKQQVSERLQPPTFTN
tara:strand:+ start:161 stop:517 length:357 start_codon:yes stop_codon:yes gene_type:complete